MKKLAFTLILIGFCTPLMAETSLVEFHKLYDNYHPRSASGQGTCENLLPTPASGIVKRCALHTSLTGNDYFWVYTSGSNAGRCCPKTSSMVGDVNNRVPLSNGAFYDIEN